MPSHNSPHRRTGNCSRRALTAAHDWLMAHTGSTITSVIMVVPHTQQYQACRIVLKRLQQQRGAKAAAQRNESAPAALPPPLPTSAAVAVPAAATAPAPTTSAPAPTTSTSTSAPAPAPAGLPRQTVVVEMETADGHRRRVSVELDATRTPTPSAASVVTSARPAQASSLVGAGAGAGEGAGAGAGAGTGAGTRAGFGVGSAPTSHQPALNRRASFLKHVSGPPPVTPGSAFAPVATEACQTSPVLMLHRRRPSQPPPPAPLAKAAAQPSVRADECLVCMDAPRNSVLVHGESCHQVRQPCHPLPLGAPHISLQCVL